MNIFYVKLAEILVYQRDRLKALMLRQWHIFKKTLILPLLTTFCVVWRPYYKVDINKFEAFQRRFLMFLSYKDGVPMMIVITLGFLIAMTFARSPPGFSIMMGCSHTNLQRVLNMIVCGVCSRRGKFVITCVVREHFQKKMLSQT